MNTQTLLDWINSQPDDRLVKMNEIVSKSAIGCVLVQYLRDCGVDFEFVTYDGFVDKDNKFTAIPAQNGRLCSSLVLTCLNVSSPTFGGLKARLREDWVYIKN